MSAATPGSYVQTCRAGNFPPLSRLHTSKLVNHWHFAGLVSPAWGPGPSTSPWADSPRARGSVVAQARRKWYAVFEPSAARGVYRVWEQVKQLVTGQPNAVHKGFASEAAALEWISHLDMRAKAEHEALEQLRKMILGPEYRTGRPASLVAATRRDVASLSSSSNGNPSSVEATPATAAPRPWETAPIVLAVPTAPSREYYRKWYAVRFVDGGRPGVYNTWQEAEAAISGRYAEHRSFDSQAEALAYAFGPEYAGQLQPPALPPQHQQQQQALPQAHLALDDAAARAADAWTAGDFFEAAVAAAVTGSHPFSAGQARSSPLSPQRVPFHGCEQDSDQAPFHGFDSGEWSVAEAFADVYPHPPPLVAPSLTSFRAPALAAGDAAAVRPPPVNPGGAAASAWQRAPQLPPGAGGRPGPAGASSSGGGGGGVGLPVPPVAAMTAPSYHDTLGRPSSALVLPAAPAPASPAIAPSTPSSSSSSAFSPCTGGRPLSATSWARPGPRATSPAMDATSPGLTGSRGVAGALALGICSGPPGAGRGPDLQGREDCGMGVGSSRDGGLTGEEEEAATTTGSSEAEGAAVAAKGRPPKIGAGATSRDTGARGIVDVQKAAGVVNQADEPKRSRGRPRTRPFIEKPADAPVRARGRPRTRPVVEKLADEPKRSPGRPQTRPFSVEKPADAPVRARGRPRTRPVADAPRRPPGRPRTRLLVEKPADAPKRARGGPRKPPDAPKRPPGRPRTRPLVEPVIWQALVVENPLGWAFARPDQKHLCPGRPHIMVMRLEPRGGPPGDATASPASSSDPASALPLLQSPTVECSNFGFSLLLLDGVDKSLVCHNDGVVLSEHATEAACALLNTALKFVRRRKLTRVQLLGTGITSTRWPERQPEQQGQPLAQPAPKAHEAGFLGARAVGGGKGGSGADEQLTGGVAEGWSILDEQSLPEAVRPKQALVMKLLERTPAVELLTGYSEERDALLSLASSSHSLRPAVAAATPA